MSCIKNYFPTKDSRKRNGTLRCHIRPIQEAVELYHKQQLLQITGHQAATCAGPVVAAVHSSGATHISKAVRTSGTITRHAGALWPGVHHQKQQMN